ncbi:Fcf2p PWA37_000062 [Arxiozyma heterogenica]|uniref:Fcf2 pre-rRNA processing C-terminal domain-containing protein n=1 Tax=Arxiozyma heterogenica TaxID=278026 RepID=A0AAN7ZRV5_9SACH|nr:hypothetical protein RI543_004335 [Kazachstania heterogenica]
MSIEEEQTLDALFASLKEVSNKKLTPANELEKNHDSDVLRLDDSKDTEKIFRNIELDLKKLPKLNNDFDQLGSKKANSNDKKPLPTLSTTLLDETKTTQKQNFKSEAKDWFLLPKPSDHMKKQLQRDLLLIKHRAALDPKRHYKKDKWQVPDRFSIGTIMEDKTEFFSSRLTKKQRKSTILESLMADKDTDKYFKRKYSEIQVQKTSGKKSHYKKTKDMRRKF